MQFGLEPSDIDATWVFVLVTTTIAVLLLLWALGD
jgi:hypothetical protein